jgi:hypothetical protein
VPYLSDNKIVAFKAILDIYRAVSLNDFKTILMIIKQSWNGDSLSLSKDILQGVTTFYRTYKNDIDISNVVKQFGKESPKNIVTQGKIYQAKGAKKYAIILAEVYNKKLRNKIDPMKIR